MSGDTLMASWFCSVFTVLYRKRLSSPRCRSELIDSAWVVIVPGQKKRIKKYLWLKDLVIEQEPRVKVIKTLMYGVKSSGGSGGKGAT